MGEPLAYFLTWTCHGTWLHGDVRGSVAVWQNVPGTELVAPNANLLKFETNAMEGARFMLSADARAVVERAIREHAQHCKWELCTLSVRTNHVHVVVANAGATPEQMMTSFKAWATRQLRAADLVAHDQRVWTRHGSTRYLWDDRSISQAVSYVAEGQDVPNSVRHSTCLSKTCLSKHNTHTNLTNS